MMERSKTVKPVDRSNDFAQIALKGPRAAGILQRLTQAKLGDVATYHFTTSAVAGVSCLVARTGYTGEDGFELYCPPGQAEALWFALLEEGKGDGLIPCGLGARDTLRTEMKYSLYGNDIDDDHSPLEAGLGWIVKIDKADFIGKAALVAQKASGVTRKLVGFEMIDTGIPRAHYPIRKDGKIVGDVTSGTMGPSVKKAIGMGYVPVELSTEGSIFQVDIRGRDANAKVVKTPFYKKG